MLSDPGAKDENKFKVAQELSKNFEVIVSSPQYPAFLDDAMKNFLKILQDSEPLFIAEYNIQQVRKLILEMFHCLPTNEHLRPYVKQSLILMIRLLERENEDNVLIRLQIIIEIHRQYCPKYSVKIQTILQSIKGIYHDDSPNQRNKILEPRSPIEVKDLSKLNFELGVAETFITATVVLTETQTPDGNNISYNLIPKGVLLLKVLQELPIIVVLMNQLYKHNVHKDVADFIPLIITTITLQPSAQHKMNPAFNKEIFVDFIGAQIKTLSFLAYIIHIYQEAVAQQATLMVKGILGLLSLCPMEVAHLKKELLITSTHILATDLRLHFIPFMERLFDENLLFGNGWTTNQSLRHLACSKLADLVHHVRQHLQMMDLARAVHLFSKNVHDESLPTRIRTMSYKLFHSFLEVDVHPVQTPSFQCSDKQVRHVHQTAVTAMFVAAAIKELRQAILPTMVSLVRNYTLVAVVQQAGPFPMLVPGRSAQRILGMDPILGHEEKELRKPGYLTLELMLDTASIVLGSKERACKLPLTEYLAERIFSLCYDKAWYVVELVEVVLKWELQRMKDEADSGGESCDETLPSGSHKRQGNDTLPEPKKPRLASSSSGKMPEVSKPIEKAHCDAIANFLLRLACQVNDATSTANSSGEQLSKRCVALLKMALKPDVWPNCELKLAWFDRLFQTADNSPAAATTAVSSAAAASSPNFTNICTALDLLTFLLSILRKEQILAGFKPLQRGLSSLMNCANPKVIRCLHGLLSRLMSVFPTEPTNSNVASKHEELEGLYAAVTKAIYEGLGAYERNTTAPSTSLLGTLMLLKAACTNNPCYIDRLITSFMRALQRMTREHLIPITNDRQTNVSNNAPESGFSSCELLILSLDLVKNRVGVMGVEMRKAFIGSILVGLLEKSSESKVVRSIVRMLDEWMKTKTPIAINQGPSLREKSILLVKMMQCLEKRFPDDVELNIAFLELINFIYCEESLKGSELVSKLEPAFLAGLRCPQPSTRAKFFQVLDSSMRRRLHDRLLYVVCSQNWEAISAHYWIKQCLELILVTSVSGTSIHTAPASALLPSVTSVIATADASERETFSVIGNIKEEPEELLDVFAHVKEDDIDMDLSNAPNDPLTPSDMNKTGLATLVNRQIKFLESGKEVTSSQFLEAVAQLAHMDTSLAEVLWLDLFPRIWKVLGERQQQALSVELVPFLCSGAHVIQKDCQPSAINTFAEALSLCNPPIRIKPCLLKYMGKSHNLWHRMTLMLEQLAFDTANPAAHTKVKQKDVGSEYDLEPGALSHQEILDALSEMYSTLKEEDLWSGLWQRRAHLPETIIGVAYEQQGFFEQAQGTYELAMTKVRQEFINMPAPISLQSEYRLLEEHWIRCGKELNQWELLQEFGGSPDCLNYQLVLESAWRTPNWVVVRDALTQLEQACPKEYAWKVNLYRGFLAMCHPEEQHPNMVERYVELASSLCIREWRRLPAIVSHVHLTTLQAAQQVVELQEAAQIHQGLLQSRPGTLHDVKAIVKTWRNRLPVIADDLSHWSDVFTWRQHHYQFIVSHYDQQSDQQASAQSMLGVHASAQAIIHFGKVARKHNLTGVCLDSLARIYSIPSVPIVDCFQKIRQQVKCYLQAANVLGKNELQEGLEVIESTNLKYFAKEMTAELYALKGMLLAQIGRADDANKAFSAAVQMHDTLVKAWALWGDHLEQVFTKDSRNIGIGVSAITCFLHACRHQNESKSRKYLAKVLWLLTYDDDKLSLAESLDKYCVGVPPVQWLPWIPQLLVCLVRDEGKLVLNLLSQVGRMFPQAVYFPIRTLYLTLKIEQRERFKSAELAATATQASTETCSNITNGASQSSTAGAGAEGAGPIKATEPMWRCSRIMHMQRDLHPTVLSSLEGIVDQMVWFRENWYEEVLRQLRQGLAKCYAIAFENRGSVAEATITPHTLSFVKKLVATFGIGIENIANSASGSFSSAASESLARRAQATAQDPVFQRMKTQFSTDFDFTLPGAMKLHNLIHKLKKWIKILEAKTKLLPRSFLIEEKCRFLSNFNLQTAEVELPGEFLLPKHTHYYVRIARFLPRVEIVQKHNTAARRLYIRGHNGKIYPYLVVNDAGLGDARREERVLQLLRMLNNYLNKHKETSKRFLNFTVPRVVAVSPQMRLVEDNPSSATLLDIYRLRCVKRNIEHDMPIAKYYERLATIQARGSQASHQVLREIHKDVQQIMVPRTLLREWANITFPSATFYWTFRKMLTLQMALVNLAEYVLHLTRLNADMLYIHQDSGLLSVSYFKFDVEDSNGELDANRPVPFRLTPNVVEFFTMIGVAGPLTASMIAAARCLVQPSVKVAAILKAVLRDEMIAWHKKKTADEKEKDLGGSGQMEGEILIGLVNKAVNAIINRLQGLSTFDGNESKVSTLVAAANSNDNLCRMDPAWHPWL